MRRIDRVLWPVFDTFPWLDMRAPDAVRRVVHHAGYHLRNACERAAESLPFVCASWKRFGADQLRRVRLYVDGLTSRDVQ
jgi:hypothetical protein